MISRLSCTVLWFPIVSLLLSGSPWLFAQELTQEQRDRFTHCRELQKTGNWIEARNIARELVSAFEGAPPSQHRLAFINELANLEQRLGNYEAALPAYQDCLTTARSLLGDGTAPVAQIQNNLAALYQVLGDFSEAETLNHEALRIREALEGKGSLGSVPAMNNLAGLLWCIGDYGGAESLYRDALAIREKRLGADALDTARSMANLGGLLYYRNQIKDAETLIGKAVDRFIRHAGASHPDTLEALLFLGEIERAQGRPADALTLYTQVLGGRVAAFGTRSHVEVAEALRRIGDAKRELGDYEGASGAYQDSDQLYRELLREDHPDLQEGLYGLGLANLARKDLDSAKAVALRCLDLEFSNFEAMLQFTDERQRLAYQEMFKSPHLLAQLGAAEELATFLLHQKGVVVDSLIAEAQLSRESSDPRVEQARQALATARADYRAVFIGSDQGDRSLSELETLVRERQRQLIELIGAKDLRQGLERPAISEVRASLRSDEALLDYVRYQRYDGLAAFEDRFGVALSTRDETRFFDRCEAREIEGLIGEMISFFGNPQGEKAAADAAAEAVMRKLFQDLLAPAIPGITDKTKLIICPEGVLSFVPFACLVMPDGRFLIEGADLRYVSSAREVLRAPAPSNPAAGAILVGNPTFDMGTLPSAGVKDRRGLLASFSATSLAYLSKGLAPLQGAELEVGILAPVLEEKLGTPTILMKGNVATESQLREKLDRPHILHFATHGLYLPEAVTSIPPRSTNLSFIPKEVAGFQNPMFGSCLALTGASSTFEAWSRGIVPDPEADGVLMANEAAEFDLEGTLLVVLSACDTASGEATRGDGVLGLRRGFRMAGAENVISTLWPISDAATVLVMRHLYEGLATQSPADSLSATQRAFLVAFRDRTEVAEDDPLPLGGFFWAVNLIGPFLLGR